ncbi:MAG: Xaa-Pro peptidase family protein [Firmicutes bacterium]|nr:Xaa-Pro peptidase family protein [Bacillota bacterium]
MIDAKRLGQVTETLKERGFTHLVLSPGASFTYMTGLAMHTSERLTLFGCDAKGRAVLLVPRLELQQALEVGSHDVYSYVDEEGPDTAIRSFLNDLGVKDTSLVAVEETHLRMFEQDALQRGSNVQLKPGADVLMSLRLYKSEAELAHIVRAAGITDAALGATLPLLKVGMSELEVAAELEYQLKKLGSEALPFGTIVGAGARGALPHSVPGNTRIESGDLVVLDFGAVVQGYAADTTRTIAFGDPGEKARSVYETVRRAQATAVAAVRPGRTAGDIDDAARSTIEVAGYREWFTHRTGHGLGLEVHEYPSIMSHSLVPLKPGMVFTVEPGIYLPGEFGVRIEDDVLVTEDGARVLTQFERSLIVL